MRNHRKSSSSTTDIKPGQSPGAIQHDTYTGRVGGLLSVASTRRQTNPPRRAFRSNEGETVYEDLVLVGWVEAPRSARETLDLYGMDVSCAQFNRIEGRWEGCLFSEPVADMLVELLAEGEFPHAFEAFPSWAELEWRVRQGRGETERPELEVYMFMEAASAEACEAFRKRSGHDLIRCGRPTERAEGSTTGSSNQKQKS